MEAPRSIVILDFGGQYAHLIGSRVRRLGAHSVIRPAETPAGELQDAAGIILSGGPQSVYDPQSPQADKNIFDLGVPLLGICYGLQWMTQALGGEVKQGTTKEYGRTEIALVNGGGDLLGGLGVDEFVVWMSHGDEAKKLPPGFKQIATSQACMNAAFADERRKFFAVQFHPEVTHTEHGEAILQQFISLCEPTPWDIHGYADRIAEEIKREVGDRSVFMLVSGGVDSSVAFVLLNKLLGPGRVQGLLVDHGLMRKNEAAEVKDAFDALGITNLHLEDASEEFFKNLKGVTEPEKKREIIGDTFLDVQRRVSERMGLTSSQPSAFSRQPDWILGQGTIYPDTIETGATKHADKIKTHHNRVEAVQTMIEQGLVIEPLKDLYKDEVRQLGEELGLPHDFVWRHPFPGPGLGVRILCADEPVSLQPSAVSISVPHAVLPVKSVGVQGDGRTYRQAVALFAKDPFDPPEAYWDLAVSIPNTMPEFSRVLLCTSQAEVTSISFTPGTVMRERADLLREADAIVLEEMTEAGLYDVIWQFPVVLLPCGAKPGEESIVLRPIASMDAMTANAVHLPPKVLRKMTERIKALPGIDLVFLDLTSKPPATIEWE
ncbi:MAG TPA: glutamine-hydrolyzing GMP synthase [Candidatus Peribacteraceae bacterium]|nr:glutamine-hydrolyzing GMP synthase [Candidatus Peribacteraceae bacterium]